VKNVSELRVRRAALSECDEAFALVKEYYETVNVVVREDREAFRQQYFAEGAGVWLAAEDGENVGCVAMRRLNGSGERAEIKRMYVRPANRGQGIADLLIKELEDYARQCGYRWLYLDTAKGMSAAAKFYKRHEFELCEPYNHNPQAFLFMRKRLAP
jgi:GNAT superfamily N-acetyltransferase